MSCTTCAALGALAGVAWTIALCTILVLLRGAQEPQSPPQGDYDAQALRELDSYE